MQRQLFDDGRPQDIDSSAFYHYHWWHRHCFVEICKLRGRRMTAEEIRLAIAPHVPEPPHHNKWGPMISLAKVIGLIVFQGHRRHMQTDKSHGRKTDEYLIRGRGDE